MEISPMKSRLEELRRGLCSIYHRSPIFTQDTLIDTVLEEITPILEAYHGQFTDIELFHVYLGYRGGNNAGEIVERFIADVLPTI